MPRGVAYGIEIESDCALPGLGSGAPAGMSARVRPATPASLTQRWSIGSDQAAWQARVGTGHLLKVRRDSMGAFRFWFDGTARFEVSATGRDVWIASPDPGSAVMREFCDSILAWAAIVQGHHGLHASCIAFGRYAVALLGGTGQGKTTAAAAALDHGGLLVTDDLLMVAPDTPPMAVPGTHLMNLPGPVLDSGPAWVDQVHGWFDDEAWISCGATAAEPLRLVALVFLYRAAGPDLRLEPHPPSVRDLMPHALGTRGLPDRELKRFVALSDLAQTVPGWHLGVPEGQNPQDLARLLQTLDPEVE